MDWLDKEVIQVLFLLAWVLFSQLRRSALKRRRGKSPSNVISAAPRPKRPSRPDIFAAPVAPPPPVFVEAFEDANNRREYRVLDPTPEPAEDLESEEALVEASPQPPVRSAHRSPDSGAAILRDALILDSLFFRRPGRQKGF